MKRKILSVALCTISILSSTNYAIAQKGLQLGIEGTPQLSWLLNKDDETNIHFEYLPTANGSIGISSQFGFTNSLGIGLDVRYSFQGQKFNYNGVERTKKVEYLKIPLMFTYSSDFGMNFRFLGKVGPQIGILTNAKMVDNSGNDIVSDQKSAYEQVDFGAVAMAGFAYKLNDRICIHAAIRYDVGLTDAEDKTYLPNINDPLFIPNGNGLGIPTADRKLTNNMTGGLTIGLNYFFGQIE